MTKAANPATIVANSRHNGFPGLTALPGGNLLAAWKDSGAHGPAGDGILAQSISADGGITWSTPTTMQPVADGLECGDVGLWTRANGPRAGETMAAFSRRGSGVVSGWKLHTSDPTAGWSGLEQIGTALFPTWGVASNRPVELADGTLLVSLYGFETSVTYSSGYFTTEDKQSAYVFSCAPNSASFGSPVKVADGVADGVNYQEPELVVLDNGDVLCVMRSDSTRSFFRSTSTDGGQTWGPIISMSSQLGGVSGRPDLCQMASGRLILVHRPSGYDNMACYVVSTDRGVTWSRPGIIDRVGNGGSAPGAVGWYAYSQMVEVAPDVVGIVYSLETQGDPNAEPTNTIGNIAHLFFTYLSLDGVPRLV